LDQTELISWATWRFARSMNSWKRNLKRIWSESR
jgi:hypothetical protein